MTIEQTVEIPPATGGCRRLTIDVPRETPEGAAQVIVRFPNAVSNPGGNTGQGGSLSERFVGALRLSGKRSAEMQTALRNGREERDRNIF
jgi:hypothetical protein